MSHIFKKKKKNAPTPNIQFEVKEVRHRSGQSINLATGEQEVDIIIQSNDADLLNSGVNLIQIRLEQSAPKNQGNLTPQEMIEQLTQAVIVPQSRIVGVLDPKGEISHGDMQKISAGEKITKDILETKTIFANHNYRAIPKIQSDRKLKQLFAGNSNFVKLMSPKVVTRREALRGTISRRTRALFKPRIAKRTTTKISEKSTQKIRIKKGPNESIKLRLLNAKNRPITEVTQGYKYIDKSNEEGYKHPETVDVFRYLSNAPMPIAAYAGRYNNKTFLSISTASNLIEGVHIYQRTVTNRPILDYYKKIGEFTFSKASNYVSWPLIITNANTQIFRIVPIFDGKELPYIKNVSLAGDQIKSETSSIVSYQVGNKLYFQFHQLPKDVAKFELIKESVLTGTQTLAARTTLPPGTKRKGNQVRPGYEIIDELASVNDVLKYYLYSINKIGEKEHLQTITKRVYNKQADAPRIASFEVTQRVSANLGREHILKANILFRDLYIPSSEDDLKVPNDNIIQNAINRRRIARIEITRHNSYGDVESLGIYTVNPGKKIAEIDSTLRPDNSLDIELIINQELASKLDLDPIRNNILYYYEIRPITYLLSNELSFLTQPIQINVPPRGGKTGYSYHPYVFDAPGVHETGIHPSLERRSRYDLDYAGASSVAMIKRKFSKYSPKYGISIDADPIVYMSRKEREIYIRLNIDIPTYYHDLVDHWQLLAAPSSTGQFTVINNFMTKSQTVEYLDFLMPELATNAIRYVLRGVGFDMSEIITSRPKDVSLLKVL